MTVPLVFNSGLAYFIDGDVVPTPTQITILQSMAVDFKASIKKLYGQNVLPVAAGRSQIDVTGKAKFADYQPRFIRDFFGSTMATGQTDVAVNEAHTVPSASAFTIPPTNSATFLQNLGVSYTATGVPLTAVSAAPALGQYIPATSASALYTFSSADANAGVNINYDWTTTGGDTVTMSNTSAGAANTFKTVTGGSYQSNQTNVILNACIPQSLKLLDTKIGDFAMPEFDFDCIADGSGVLGTISVAQIS